MTSLSLATDLRGPDLYTEVLVQVIHHPGLYHGEAELMVASPGPQPHWEADCLRARTPVIIISSVVPQIVFSLKV